MSQADELMKGFQIGYQNAPFSALGSAIKSTLGRLTQQEDMVSGLATKAGIEHMFADPNERLLKQAQLDKTQLESYGLRDYYGLDGGANSESGGDLGGTTQRTNPSIFGRRPARTPEEALSLIPEDERANYRTEVVYTKNPLGLEEVTYKPVIKQEYMQAQGEQAKVGEEAQRNFNVARNKLKVTAGAWKAAQEKSGGGAKGAAQALFGKTQIGRMMGVNPYSQAFEGQLVEAASALAKLAAPSARVGEQIIAQFRKTLPDLLSIANPQEFEAQLRFSLQNAFASQAGIEGYDFGQEQMDMVDTLVADIIDTPAMTSESLDKFKSGGTTREFNTPEEADNSGLPIGTIVTVGGRRYQI